MSASSHVCGWMPPCTSRRQCAKWGSMGDRARRGVACRLWKRWPSVKRPDWQEVKGSLWYGEGNASWRSAAGHVYGTMPVSRSCRFALVLIRDPKGNFKTQALLSTKLEAEPGQILRWFVRRWRVEVTFEEARAHLGLETQRQWNDLAIGRRTPCLLGLYSIITLLAKGVHERQSIRARREAWYSKEQATFSDTIAVVRRSLWSDQSFQMSGKESETIKVPRSLIERFTDALCYAA